MNHLDKDITNLQEHIDAWRALYDRESLARANRMLNYMKELQKLKKVRK